MSKDARDRKRRERTTKRVTRNLQLAAQALSARRRRNAQTWADVTEAALTPGEVFTIRGVYVINPDPHS